MGIFPVAQVAPNAMPARTVIRTSGYRPAPQRPAVLYPIHSTIPPTTICVSVYGPPGMRAPLILPIRTGMRRAAV